MSALLDIAKRAITRASELGADEIEVFVARQHRLTVVEVLSEDVLVSSGVSEAIAVRAVVGRSLGFAAATGPLTEDLALEVAKRAVRVARAKPEDPHFKHLPDPRRPLLEHGPVDDRILSLDDSELVSRVAESLRRAQSASPHLERVEGSVERLHTEFAIANSRGIERVDSGTWFEGWAMALVKRDSEMRQALWYFVSRRYEEEKLLALFGEAAKIAESCLGAKDLPPDVRTGDVILESLVVPWIFARVLGFNLNARNVQEGRSVWRDKLGEKIASEKLTLVDDGTHPEGPLSASVDGEGVPMQRKVVIDRGVLKTFLYDSYAAHREGKESTGNAVRDSPMSEPRVSFTNVIIEPGSGSLDDLVAEVERGILIRSQILGAHLVDPMKGVLAVTCPNAFLVVNGEIKHPLRPVIVSLNVFDALRSIKRVGGDSRWVWAWRTPSLVVSGAAFA